LGYKIGKQMRYKKKELIRKIQLLERANQIAQDSGYQNMSALTKLLEKCQRAAMETGACLEGMAADQGQAGVWEVVRRVVGILEGYCEDLYQLSISQGQPKVCKIIIRKIRAELIQVKELIQYELPPDRKEIVFLPYKASMWDSLESVWMAARDDRQCDAYVVPIPYFDRNSDGSLGEMHYEGEEYPENVPIVDWREYVIADRKPDLIYIHNAYDDGNYVTSVHPAFYSSELKKNTEMLVYIPYFTGINDKVLQHLCVVKGILSADKTIVESEKIKKIYLNALRNFEKENGCYGKFGNFEKKIVALGSPKLEKAAQIGLRNNLLPADWSALIEKGKTGKKKVIFYNTTIAALLKYNQQYLKKLKSVLEFFKTQENIVLLWRPHPLLQSTIKTMRSHLYEEYKEIVKEYQLAGWGIYDDTAELERAIGISDAYYGDMSSVVELYKVTGKPIMIQKVDNGTGDFHG